MYTYTQYIHTYIHISIYKLDCNSQVWFYINTQVVPSWYGMLSVYSLTNGFKRLKEKGKQQTKHIVNRPMSGSHQKVNQAWSSNGTCGLQTFSVCSRAKGAIKRSEDSKRSRGQREYKTKTKLR